jgi:CheY-like chemotaxis protein
MCSGTCHQILLVENEWLIAEQMAEMLTQLGFDVVGPAPHSRRALALINESDVCAAVLDVNLSDERSFPIAEALAQRGIPFVFVTGYEEHDLPAEFSASPILTKPVDPENLRVHLTQLIESGDRDVRP